jgi:DNA-binding protein
MKVTEETKVTVAQGTVTVAQGINTNATSAQARPQQGKQQGGGFKKHGHQHERQERKMDDNVIYIGKKGVMNYVMAAITQMNKGEKEIHIKARGRSISKAVDVVQLLKNKFETATQVKKIDIGTEEVTADEGGKINVSTIDLIIGK